MGGHLHHQPVAAATAVVVQPPPPPFPHHQPHFLGHQPAAARGGSAHGSESGDAVVARWLQSAGLQHLAAPLAASALDPRLLPGLLAQDHSRYGIQSLEDKQKFFKLGKTIGSVAESPIEHPATPSYAGSGNRSKMDGFPEIKEDFSPGLLDLHATDTELLSEGAGTGLFDSCSPFVPVTEHGFENGLDSLLFAGKQLSSRLQGPIERSPLRSTSTEKERGNKDNGLAKIKVVVRKRPLNKKELSRKEEDIISVEEQGCFLTVHEPKLKVDLTAYIEKHEFVFDAVLDGHVSNEEVYSVTVEPIVPTIFQRTKATCFAYGQTGSGKTYTMQPLPLKASQDILNMMQQPSYRNQGFQLWLSFFEIYGGKLFDLLNERSKLCMREDGRQQVCIVGLREFQVCDVELVKEYIEKGNAARSTGSTGANEESSRSHAILQLSLKKKTDRNEARPGRLVGKLSFIDLAGSERGADTTDNDRQTRLEGAEINKSLLALKECIRALDNDQGHIPFRGSKLTEVLRDSFVGDSRTVMISCISPNTGSCEHTLNTLRYADRVKGLSRSGNSKKDPYSSVPPQKDSAVSYQAQISPLEVLNIEEDLLAEDGRQTFRDDHDGASITSMDHRLYPNGDNNRMALPLNNIRDNYSSALGSTRDAPVGNFQEDQEQEKIHIVLPYRRKTSREGRSERPLNANEKEELHERGLKELTMSNALHTSADDVVMVRPKDAQINALLKEEEELLSAHRKEVEDTIEIVREEMKLLGEVDQPGSRIDQYVTQLNEVLSRKAAGLLNFQARLARFQRLLKEQDVIGRSKALRQL